MTVGMNYSHFLPNPFKKVTQNVHGGEAMVGMPQDFVRRKKRNRTNNIQDNVLHVTGVIKKEVEAMGIRKKISEINQKEDE